MSTVSTSRTRGRNWEAKEPPRVVLADDHAEVLNGIRDLLEPDFQVVSTTHDGNSLLEAVREHRPDVVVTDVEMPGRNGIDAAREILGRKLCQAVVVLTLYKDVQFVRSALGLGVRGYVLKVDAGEELIPALLSVMAGERYLSRGVPRTALA